jgi:hypothetical protein
MITAGRVQNAGRDHRRARRHDELQAVPSAFPAEFAATAARVPGHVIGGENAGRAGLAGQPDDLGSRPALPDNQVAAPPP